MVTITDVSSEDLNIEASIASARDRHVFYKLNPIRIARAAGTFGGKQSREFHHNSVNQAINLETKPVDVDFRIGHVFHESGNRFANGDVKIIL
ncbi:unnamed protein product [Echinostoma caproni]|uniref:MOSC domain-containing protein n=1 Tax=Echinostoma caproni TaxID=27848 RepID=A0A183AJN3_9TREM|nr:unnamed protein product [Echinostoma caproni]